MHRFIDALVFLLIVGVFVFIVPFLISLPSCLDDFSKTKAGREADAFVEEWFTPIEDGRGLKK